MSPTEIEDNARGWSELMKLVRVGHSWSGGERNRMFLNGGGTFHEMSHLAGLDHAGDGRGLAVVDWDHDGRLDLWYRNRTAPRLRLMMNRRETTPPAIAIRLEGATANRDGIGAVVELLPAGNGGRLVRSVRVGDLFLSQSSKWLHFGGTQGAQDAEVLWPGGERERFGGGFENGGRYLLKQGSGTAVALEMSRKPSALRGEALEAAKDTGDARIILPARIPLPAVKFRDQAARLGEIRADGKPRLLLLWSGDCAHCKRTMKSFAAVEKSFRSTGVEVLALSVEGMAGPAADTSAAYDLIDATGFPFIWGLIDAASAERIHKLQTALFDRTPAGSVPLAIMLDEAANAVAIYRGSIQINEVLEDWKLIQRADEKTLYHLAPPLRGTWFTNPMPRADLLRFIGSE